MAHDATLAAIDFEKRFPHRFWYSSWFADAEHPAGCRYKLVSTRSGPQGPYELVVQVEDSGGGLMEAHRVEVSGGAFEKTAAVYVDGLSEGGKLTFFAIDLIRCGSRSAFTRILEEAGWFKGPQR